MKYTIESLERKSIAGGKNMIKAVLKGEDGVHEDNVAIWDTFPSFNVLAVGQMVEGDINVKVNGQYTNKSLYAPKPVGGSTGRIGGNAGMSKMMDKKNESIKGFQDTKEVAIKLASAMRDAVQLAIAELEGQDKTALASRITHWRSWIISHWGDETDVKSPF
jgi:hypothetical protein